MLVLDAFKGHLTDSVKNQLRKMDTKLVVIPGGMTSVLQPMDVSINPYPTAFPYGNGMVLHFYQQQESSTTKTVHKVINKGLKAYV